MKTRRSHGWWGLIIFALLATLAYVAFDLLDLDGSGLRALAVPGTTDEELAQAEVERFLRTEPSPLGGSVCAFLPATDWAIREAPPSATGPAARLLLGGHGWSLPRRHVRHESASTDSPATDPA